MDEADRLLPQEPDAVVLSDWVDTLRRRLSATEGLPRTSEMTAAEQRVLEQLETHLSLAAAIADHLYVSRNTVKSHTLAMATGRWCRRAAGAAVERARSTGLLPRRRRGRPLRVRCTPAGVVEGIRISIYGLGVTGAM